MASALSLHPIVGNEMATPLFQTDFERAPSALESFEKNFLDTRIKEGTKAYERMLKAADPKFAVDIYKEEMKLLTALEKQLSGLKSSKSGGGSVTYTTRLPSEKDIFKLEQNIIDDQVKQQDDYVTGKGGYTTQQARVRKTLSQIEQAETPEARKNLTRSLQRHIQSFQDDARNRTRGAGHAFGEAVMEDARGLSDETRQAVFGTLRANKLTPNSEDLKIYAEPRELRAEDQERLNKLRKGTTDVRSTQKQGTAGVDPSTLASDLIKRIAAQRIRVERARDNSYAAREEYRSLAAGPNVNLAISPLASRPSQRSDALAEYARLAELDPERAESVLDASRDAGKLTIPDRLAQLRADPDAGGKAPIDTVLDRVGALEALTGYSRAPTEAGRFGVDVDTRDLTSTDIPSVRQAMQDMLTAVKSPMFEDQQFGSIDSMGDTLEFENYLENAISALDETREKDPSMAAQLAQNFSKDLVDWKDSQDDREIGRLRSDTQPGYAVSRSINRIRTAKREADKSGDTKMLAETVANEANRFRAADDFTRSAYGDEFIERVEDFKDHRDFDYFEQSLIELQPAAEEAAVGITDIGETNGTVSS